jgi:putative ABC transport system permease protein
VAASEVRLRVPTQVDASADGTTVLVPGELMSVRTAPPADGEPALNGLDVRAGRAFGPADAQPGASVVAVDEHFAEVYDVDVPTRFRVGGGQEVTVVARALAPEHFIIRGRDGGFLAQSNHAVLFAPLPTVQRLAGLPGQANDVVLALRSGVDPDRVARELERVVAEVLPDAPVDVWTVDDDPVRTQMYDDIDGDQRLFDIFAVIVLAGAAFAAFNLTGRILEAQRREFGIGLALGVPVLRLAARPALVGAQVAFFGVVAGLGMGLIMQAAMSRLWQSLFPLPAWTTEFQPAVFARGAALGFVLPLVASVLPLRRTLRMAPVDAIRTTHRTPSGGWARWLARLPGSALTQLPLRNVLRAPRRTLLTAVGLGAAVAVLVGVMGLIDSVLATVDRGEADILADSPDRIEIDLESFGPADGPVVAAASDPALVEDAETGLRLPGRLGTGDDAFDVFVQTVDFSSPLWRPGVVRGSLDERRPGVVISAKAARDLDADVGDRVVLRHPVREGLGYRFEETSLPVLAVHGNPYRFLVYVDDDRADLFNLDGIVNTVRARPVVPTEQVQRELFVREGVQSVQPVSRFATSIRDRLEETIGLFDIVQVMVLLMAVLIAFNSTTINVDERAREHATMFAFGLPLRRVVWTSAVESAITGLLGTLLGLVVGRLLVGWMASVLLPRTLPDLEITPMVGGATVVTAFVVGVGAVTLAPLLTIRRLRRMNLPATLRVVE